MSLKSEIPEYRDTKDFLVHPWKLDKTESNKSGNGVFYTGEYYTLLALNNELNETDKRNFEFFMRKLQVEKGLYNRSSDNFAQNGADDFYGLLTGAYHTQNYDLAQEVIDYGNKHFWIFNNVKPGSLFHLDGRVNLSAMFFRFPALIAHAYWAANKTPPLFFYFIWCLVVAFSCTKGRENGTDPFRITWSLVKTNDNRGWLAKLVSKLFYKRLKKHFPNGTMNEVASVYYQTDHPFSKYWKD